jgi:hypothetical protein
MKNLLVFTTIAALLFSAAARAQSGNDREDITKPGYTGDHWTVKNIAATTNYLLVYPNPAITSTNIVLPEMAATTVMVDVIDLNGRIDRSFQYTPGALQLQVDMSGLPAGLYSMRVYGLTSGYYNLKVVKE